MPAGVVFHVGNALALDSLGKDDGGLTLGGLCLGKGGFDGVEVVTVDGDDVCTESAELVIQGLGGHNVAGFAVDLQTVHVHDGAQVVQMILVGGHKGFPHLTLGNLAVAQHSIDTIILVAQLTGQRHTDGGRDSLTQRAGGHIDTGNVLHFHVARHMTVDAAEHLQLFHGEEAAQCQRGIDGGRAVTLTHDEAVTLGITGVGGIDLHLVEIKSGQNIQTAQRTTGMAGGGLVDHLNGKEAGFGGSQRQRFLVSFHVIVPLHFIIQSAESTLLHLLYFFRQYLSMVFRVSQGVFIAD